jgi:hypothetical protein
MVKPVSLKLSQKPPSSDGRIVLDPPGDGNCGWSVLLGVLVALFETFGLVTALGLPATADDLRVIVRGQPDVPKGKDSAALKEATSYHVDVVLGVARQACLWDEPLQFLQSIRVEHQTIRSSAISGHWVASVPSREIAQAFCRSPRPDALPVLSCLPEHFRIAREELKAIEETDAIRMFATPVVRKPGKKSKAASKASTSSTIGRASASRDEEIANDLAIALLLSEDESRAAQAKRAQEASDASLAAWASRRK